ncbi:hypothetical protein [Nitrospira sp. BLG_2]|uniref:hypothetical protein n=1 Tax=Nitrospira sp. BLG_2 TaxID=3397507 RepID=UPI003B9C72C4
MSTFRHRVSAPHEDGKNRRTCPKDSMVKHVSFTIRACRSEDRQTGLAEQELMS